MSIKNIFKNKKFLLALILLLAILLRTIGFNWDKNQHLHPDERFLTMVVADIELPASFANYLDPNKSTLNPYNNDYRFFVYGSFPINIVRLIAEKANLTNYHQVHFIGRFLTILLDISIVFLIYLIAKKVLNYKFSLIASFIYAISVLPIQLAHFYTVDPFLNFFIFLSFYFLLSLKEKKKFYSSIIFLSISFSLALTSKISAVYFLPIIFLSFLLFFFKNKKLLFISSFLFIFLTLLFSRFFQPQFFTSASFLNWNLNPQFINNIKELQRYSQNKFYPPGIQWLQTIPIIFPLKNILFWGLGIPLSLFFIPALFYSVFYLTKKGIKKNYFLFLILFYFIYFFLVQGCQKVTTMRYFLSLYPFIALITAFFIYQIYFKRLKLYKFKLVNISFLVFLLIYPLSFLAIYLNQHPRVTASQWIYNNIPHNSTLAVEYWDDPLPLVITSNISTFYNYQSLNIASPDSPQKISKFKYQLGKSDYIILSSNRFYLPIPKNSDVFPFTSNYYKQLFNGSLGFEKVAEFNSYPSLSLFGKTLLTLNDDHAEEAFTVYDHPKVIIFRKTSQLNLKSLE
jgi:Dolichyl-phosphate-mannose-protein mannosyltransferase